MMEFLESTLVTIGTTDVTPLHILTIVIAGTVMGWTYFKGLPFHKTEDKFDPYEHKTLNDLREPEIRHIINKYGKTLDREFYYDKRKIGIIDREINYWVGISNEKDSAERVRNTIIPDHIYSELSNESKKELSRVSLFYVRKDSFGMTLLKKIFGIPQRYYNLFIVPERFLIDADAIVLDKNVNIIRYAGIDTVQCSEVSNLFNALTSKNIEEQVDENTVNFLRRLTHFDTEQAKQTQFKKFETDMELARWGDKDQRDSSKV